MTTGQWVVVAALGAGVVYLATRRQRRVSATAVHSSTFSRMQEYYTRVPNARPLDASAYADSGMTIDQWLMLNVPLQPRSGFIY